MEKIRIWMKRFFSSFKDIPVSIWQRHILLGIATYISMTVTYYSFTFDTGFSDKLISSLLYSTVLVIILLSHELGHYLHAREYGVETTLPFFIPLPYLSPFGTLGAYIRMKTLPPDRRALFDISFWGPAMSFLMSIPALIIGLLLSQKIPMDISVSGFIVGKNDIIFGNSILFDIITKTILNIPDGYTLILHPVAFAGWIGLFVTAINLFPIGQLDGGHIAYVFLGKRQIYIAYVFLGILIFLALNVSPGWIFWIFMLVFMGLKHPPIRTAEHGFKLDRSRAIKGIISALIFVICFIPEPVRMNALVKPGIPLNRQEFHGPQIRHGVENLHEINFLSPDFSETGPFDGESGWK